MLGTNELKYAYNKTAKEIEEIFEQKFAQTILNRKSQFRDTYPKLLIVTPVAIKV